MSDIAEAAKISRPTLYSVFPNKDALFEALVEQSIEQNSHITPQRLATCTTAETRLRTLFDVWIIGPYREALRSAKGQDLVVSASVYAPRSMRRYWEAFGLHLLGVLPKSAVCLEGADLSDFVRVLVAATQHFKAEAHSLKELNASADLVMSVILRASQAEGTAP